MPPRNLTAEGMLDLAIEKSPALRRAGVLSVTLDGLTLHLAPPEPPPVEADTKTPPEPVDAMDDPRTYGLPPGARLPGFGDPQGFDEDE